MADSVIHWSERAPDQVREIPLGIYSGRSPEAAISRAGREWSLADDCLIAEALPGASRGQRRGSPVLAPSPRPGRPVSPSDPAGRVRSLPPPTPPAVRGPASSPRAAGPLTLRPPTSREVHP
jgi:hypothetical protein